MPAATIPTVSPGFSLTAGLQRFAGLAAALCRLGGAWFRPSRGGAPTPRRLQRDELMAMSSSWHRCRLRRASFTWRWWGDDPSRARRILTSIKLLSACAVPIPSFNDARPNL